MQVNSEVVHCRGPHDHPAVLFCMRPWPPPAEPAARGRRRHKPIRAGAIRIIVPLPPGATADTLPRLIGEKLTAKWGQPVIIENRPGAAQNLGAEMVAKAEPDGYTLLATPQGPLTISPYLYPRLSFDPAAFVPITIMAAPALCARHLSGVTDIEPRGAHRLRQGQSGQAQLCVARRRQLEPARDGMAQEPRDIRLTHVPYRGAAPALTDLLAGHVDIMFDNAGTWWQLIKDGRLKALAVSARARMAELPDVRRSRSASRSSSP